MSEEGTTWNYIMTSVYTTLMTLRACGSWQTLDKGNTPSKDAGQVEARTVHHSAFAFRTELHGRPY